MSAFERDQAFEVDEHLAWMQGSAHAQASRPGVLAGWAAGRGLGVPASPVHAVHKPSGLTACGRDAAYSFPRRSWPAEPTIACVDCLEATGVDP